MLKIHHLEKEVLEGLSFHLDFHSIFSDLSQETLGQIPTKMSFSQRTLVEVDLQKVSGNCLISLLRS